MDLDLWHWFIGQDRGVGYGEMGGVQTKAGQLTRSRLVLEPLAAALLLGVAADQLFRLPYPWGYLAVLGSPWVVIAWLCARRHRHLGPALLAAAVVVVGGLIVFGLFKLLAYVFRNFNILRLVVRCALNVIDKVNSAG